MNRITSKFVSRLFTLAAVLAFAVAMTAQVKTETATTTGQPTHEVTVERGEVVLVDGNDLILKMEDGSLRHIPNVPESARATVDGKEVGIHDLQPGMKLEHTITTTSTPRTITTTQSVTGKVWHVNPPTSVILQLDNGTNQSFTIPKGQKFKVDGQTVDAWGLKKGMKISATKVVEVPEVHVSHNRALTATAAPPPPPVDIPLLIVYVAHPVPAAEETTAEATPTALPKTGGPFPLVGLAGLLACAASMALGMVRRFRYSE